MTKEAVSSSMQEAMRAAFQQHYVPLLRMCVLLSGQRETAEDIVQDAFVRVASRIQELSTNDLGPYLRRVAVNIWKNRLRRLSLERRVRAKGLERRLEATALVEDRDTLWTAVMRLPPRQRACLVLRYYEDLPEHAVADVLGCSVGTVKSQTSRALALLRKEFRGED